MAVVGVGVILGATLLATGVLALVTDAGTVDVQVADKNHSKVDQQTNAGAFVSYFGDSDTTFGSSGTGNYDPFVRLQGSPTERGYNTNGTVQFDTKTGKWTHAILVSQIPQRPCPGPEDPAGAPPPPVLGSLTCFELWVDINEGNSAKHISLNEVEIYYASGPAGTPGNPPPASLLVGYPFTTPSPASVTVTKEYDFSGTILINDVNQGSGRGDLRYNVPIGTGTDQVPLPANCNYGNTACTTYFVLYSQWGTTGLSGGINYNSEGGFEEWKVRIYPTPPDVQVVKTPDISSIAAGANATFTIVVTNNGPIAAENVVLSDVLPDSGLSWTVGGTNAAACTGTNPHAGGSTLTCNFGTIPNGESRTITLTSATGTADCARNGGTGRIDNTATITASNEGPITSNNSDPGDISVNCAAIQILKKSTKSGNPIVGSDNTPGLDPTPLVTTDNATFVVTPNPRTGSGTLTVVDNGANDADTDYGEVCVSGVVPAAAPGYSVDETVAPNGYGLPASANDPQNTGAVTAGSTCASGAASITFLDPPLAEIEVLVTDLGSGETHSSIVCTGLTPVAENGGADPAFDDTDEVFTNLAPGSYSCTVVVDP